MWSMGGGIEREKVERDRYVTWGGWRMVKGGKGMDEEGKDGGELKDG